MGAGDTGNKGGDINQTTALQIEPVNLCDIQEIDFDKQLKTVQEAGASIISWRKKWDKIVAAALLGNLVAWPSIALFSNSVAIGCLAVVGFFSLVIALGGVFVEGGNPFKFRLASREERQYRRAVKSFLKKKRGELVALRTQALQFDKALVAFKKAMQLLGDAVTNEMKTASAQSLAERRNILSAEIDDFFDGLTSALNALQEQCKLMCVSTEEIRRLEDRRKKFRAGVAALKRLYAELPGYDGGTLDMDEVTRGLAPYATTDLMRDRLEAECLELGISPNELPSPPKTALRLPAKAGG